ncbi:DNA-directed RNA polymerase subunit delta [Virgibacillus xinjiangensis]|uniref:Probable DNA-directed RNA polymerase subunit delta n=1 Tax=Virgibacillus xinjiangensis TaxID=393090 RepID=A0ABV7CU23_9BACI
MSLKDYSHEELKGMSKLELANLVLLEEKKALDFQELFSRVAEHKELSDSEQKEGIAQFYTDMNVDGRFLTLGSNVWGLKRWYPVEQMDEEITDSPKKKKKKPAKKKKVEEEEVFAESDDLDFFDDDLEDVPAELGEDLEADDDELGDEDEFGEDNVAGFETDEEEPK